MAFFSPLTDDLGAEIEIPGVPSGSATIEDMLLPYSVTNSASADHSYCSIFSVVSEPIPEIPTSMPVLPSLPDSSTDTVALGFSLMQDYLDSALNANTVKQYRSSHWHYTSFCELAQAPPYPGDPELVGSCLSLRAYESGSLSAVEKLHASIAFEHRKRFLPSPTGHPTISLLMRGIRLSLSRPCSPVRPLPTKSCSRLGSILISLDLGLPCQNGAQFGAYS
jgi:hypothetical protein